MTLASPIAPYISCPYVPDGCAAIGDRAFEDCYDLAQIRVPADCELGEDVFDGCGLVYVFSEAYSPAESYCAEHENCVFVEEETERL